MKHNISENVDKLFPTNPSDFIKHTLEELNESITSRSIESSNRLNQFEKKYEVDFPLSGDSFTRGMADGMVYALLDESLILYALSMNSLCILELHGIMERVLLREVPSMISAKGMENHISKLLERKTLFDLSKILQGITVFDENDLVLIKQLKDLRDGIAHKNSELISKTLHGSNPKYIHDVILSDSISLTMILGCIRLLIKIAKLKSPTAISVVEKFGNDGHISPNTVNDVKRIFNGKKSRKILLDKKCKGICKNDRRFSFKKGSRFCNHCDVFVNIAENKCPCCSLRLSTKHRSYIKKADRV